MTRKQPSARLILAVASFLVLLVLPIPVFASELILSQPIDGPSVYGPSIRIPSGVSNAEVADDFNLVASVERVVASGYVQGPVTGFQGAYVSRGEKGEGP